MQEKDKKNRKGEDTTILTHFSVLRIYLCYYSGVSTGHAPSGNEVLDHFGGSRKKKIFLYFKQGKQQGPFIYSILYIIYLFFKIPDISIKINMCHFQFYITV